MQILLGSRSLVVQQSLELLHAWDLPVVTENLF